jgi:putative transposase
MRAAMNAILYLLRTGCPWRHLPRGRFPPRSTVYNIFRKFQRNGVWEARSDLRRNARQVACVKFCKLIMVSGEKLLLCQSRP